MKVRAEHSRQAVCALYAALGAGIFDSPGGASDDLATRERRGTRAFLEPILAEAGLPASLASDLDDHSYDPLIRAETEHAHAQAKDTEIFRDHRNRYGAFGQMISWPDPWASGWWRYRWPAVAWPEFKAQPC